MKNIDITVKSFQTKVHKVKFTRALIGGECQMIEEVDKLKRKFTIIKVQNSRNERKKKNEIDE